MNLPYFSTTAQGRHPRRQPALGPLRASSTHPACPAAPRRRQKPPQLSIGQNHARLVTSLNSSHHAIEQMRGPASALPKTESASAGESNPRTPGASHHRDTLVEPSASSLKAHRRPSSAPQGAFHEARP